MAWALQPCMQTEGRESAICDGSYVLARIPSPVWDKKRRDLDPRDRPAALLMTAAPVLFAAVRGFVDACGGNPPDWLKAEFTAAEDALQLAGNYTPPEPVTREYLCIGTYDDGQRFTETVEATDATDAEVAAGNNWPTVNWAGFVCLRGGEMKVEG